MDKYTGSGCHSSLVSDTCDRQFWKFYMWKKWLAQTQRNDEATSSLEQRT